MQVLIADNEAAIRKGLAHCLDWAAQGCEIVGQVSDGIEALEFIAAHRVDILISDIRMPGMDGLSLCEALSREHPRVKMILLTGFPDFDYAQKAIACGVVDFVLKPTSADNLVSALGKAKKRLLEEQNWQEISRKLENQSEQNLRLEQSLFLNELIHNNKSSMIYTLNRLSQLNLTGGTYHLLYVCISLPGADDAEIDYKPMQEETHAILSTCLQALHPCYVPQGGQYSYVLVDSGDGEWLHSMCEEAVEIVGGLLRQSVSIGVSGAHANILEMATAAHEARQAQQFAFYSGESRVVSFLQVPVAGKAELAQITDALKQLHIAVEFGHKEEAARLLDLIFDTAAAAGLSLREQQKIGAFVYHFCAELALYQEDEIPEFPLLEVLAADTETSLRENLRGFMGQMLSAASRPDDSSAVIQAVKKHIKTHFKEDLTLEQLSGLVYLSPSYLSKLFKKEAGENLSGYIQGVRIEKAKELLLSTQLKSYEVAEMVGISDPVYFSRLFKRVTGKKPKDFRAGIMGGEGQGEG